MEEYLTKMIPRCGTGWRTQAAVKVPRTCVLAATDHLMISMGQLFNNHLSASFYALPVSRGSPTSGQVVYWSNGARLMANWRLSSRRNALSHRLSTQSHLLGGA